MVAESNRDRVYVPIDNEPTSSRRNLLLGAGAAALGLVGAGGFKLGRSGNSAPAPRNEDIPGGIPPQNEPTEVAYQPTETPEIIPHIDIAALKANQRTDIWSDRRSPNQVLADYYDAVDTGNIEDFMSPYYVYKTEVMGPDGKIDLSKALRRLAENLNELLSMPLDPDRLAGFAEDQNSRGFSQSGINELGIPITRAVSGLSEVHAPDDRIRASSLHGEVEEALSTIQDCYFTAAEEGNANVFPKATYDGHDFLEKADLNGFVDHRVNVRMTASIRDMSEGGGEIVGRSGNILMAVREVDGLDRIIFSRTGQNEEGLAESPFRKIGSSL